MKAATPHPPAKSAALKSATQAPLWSACVPIVGETIREVADRADQPTKEQIREWLKSRRIKSGPPPNMEQIRRDLGWKPV